MRSAQFFHPLPHVSSTLSAAQFFPWFPSQHHRMSGTSSSIVQPFFSFLFVALVEALMPRKNAYLCFHLMSQDGHAAIIQVGFGYKIFKAGRTQTFSCIGSM